MKRSIIKSCDILFSTMGGYYQVTEAKNDFLYSHALHTKPKHCFDDVQPLLPYTNIKHSSEHSHDVDQPGPFQGCQK